MSLATSNQSALFERVLLLYDVICMTLTPRANLINKTLNREILLK